PTVAKRHLVTQLLCGGRTRIDVIELILKFAPSEVRLRVSKYIFCSSSAIVGFLFVSVRVISWIVFIPQPAKTIHEATRNITKQYRAGSVMFYDNLVNIHDNLRY